MPGYGRRQTWGRIYSVLSLLLSVRFRDWIALLTGRLWLVTHVRHYRKLFKTHKEEDPEISSEIVAGVVVVGYAMPKGTTHRGGRVEGGSKLKIEEIALAANETVAPLLEILLT